MSPPDDPITGGAIIHLGFSEAGRVWWIDQPHRELEPERIAALGNRLVECCDSLFGWRGFSQTWRIVEDD